MGVSGASEEPRPVPDARYQLSRFRSSGVKRPADKIAFTGATEVAARTRGVPDFTKRRRVG